MVFQDVLLESLRRNSDKTAIEENGEATSYAQLLSLSDKVTAFLLENGVERQTVVGIRLTRRPDLIAAVIGVIRAGGVFVLLDPAMPRRRMEALLAEVRLDHLITEESWLEVAGRENVAMDADPSHEPGDSLYIYFTSGSTGTPKGIVGRNDSLLQFLRWEIDAFQIEGTVRVSQFISPYFDAFLRDVFVPLLTGGVICVPPADVSFFSPERMVEWIDANHIRLIHCVPSVWRVVNSGPLHSGLFPDLKYILLSGEKIISSELSGWYEVFGTRIQMVNLYGATETTMIRTCYLIRPEDARTARIPIGEPIYDTALLVAHKDLTPCDTLVPGDLYIISDYMSAGYLNDPLLTNEKFTWIDMGKEGRKIAFRTGDRARILAGAKIDLIGREDRQIKLRGIRIEPDEIENVLMRSGLVKLAVVMRHTEADGSESLIAFAGRAEGQKQVSKWAEAIETRLREELPAYMVPSDIVEVESIPLLSNGKTDYKALASRLTKSDVIAPVNDTETRLLGIWKEILGDKPISTDDSFHKIGGNSLSIMKLIGRIYKEYNIRISLNDLFNNLNIKKQADLIRHAKKDLLYVITPAQRKPGYHVSAAQERIYYNQQLNKEAVPYNVPTAWVIEGRPDREQIENAFRRLIERHESLRTEFRIVDGELLQFVKESIPFQLAEAAQQEDDGDIRDVLFRLIRPFDLGAAPLIRCTLIRTLQGKDILLADVHNIVCDGISQAILLSDFYQLYKGVMLKPLAIQYKDYAEWEFGFRNTEEYLAHREFWLSAFEGTVPALDLPVSQPLGGDMAGAGGTIQFEIAKRSIEPLLSYLRAEGITPFAGMFSLYLLFLAQLTGQEDIVIGVTSAGRMQQELENVLGMFVKALPIRCRLDPGTRFRDLLRDLHRLLIQARSRQVYDITNIVIELNNGRTPAVKSLFNVMFAFQDYLDQWKLEDISVFPLENAGSKFPLTLFVNDWEDCFHFRLEYQSACFTLQDAELLAGQFADLLLKACAHMDGTVLEIIGAGESQSDLIGDDVAFNF